MIKRKDHEDQRKKISASVERVVEMSLELEKLIDNQLDALHLVRLHTRGVTNHMIDDKQEIMKTRLTSYVWSLVAA